MDNFSDARIILQHRNKKRKLKTMPAYTIYVEHDTFKIIAKSRSVAIQRAKSVLKNVAWLKGKHIKRVSWLAS